MDADVSLVSAKKCEAEGHDGHISFFPSPVVEEQEMISPAPTHPPAPNPMRHVLQNGAGNFGSVVRGRPTPQFVQGNQGPERT